jgi:hypothetical protein
MFALLTNTITGESFIRSRTSSAEDVVIAAITPNYASLKKTIATDAFDLVSKAIRAYIDSKFTISIEPVNSALCLCIKLSEKKTLELLRSMFDELDEAVRLTLEDSDFPKLSKRLVSKFDKQFAKQVSRRKETNDDGEYESYYQLLKDRI